MGLPTPAVGDTVSTPYTHKSNFMNDTFIENVVTREVVGILNSLMVN